MSNNKHLTLKEQGFVTDLIKLKNGTDAAENNYNVKSRANARSMAVELRKKPRIQQAIQLEMEKQGLTPDVVVNALKENIIQGIGVKATAESTNRGIELWGKFTGAFDKEDVQESYKVTLSRLNSKELQEELERLNKLSTSLIADFK
mgnify:CR=1 FL=1